jgi:hypothetical protein
MSMRFNNGHDAETEKLQAMTPGRHAFQNAPMY